MIDYESYKKAVYDDFKRSFPGYGEKADPYLKSEEDTIRSRYEYELDQLKKGKITEKQMMIGGVSALSYCLHMMY